MNGLMAARTSRNDLPLFERVALVTGASRGIGAAIARRLAADGAAVAITFNSSSDKAAELVEGITAAGRRATAIRADAGDVFAARASVAQTVDAFGRLDILVNNAGLGLVKQPDEFTIEDFNRMIDVNLKGLFFTTQEALRHMCDGGRIINIGSINSERLHFTGGTLYTMTKSGVAGLTKALAHDLGPRGITVNNVLPGPIDTDMNPATGKFAPEARSQTVLNRYAKPEEVADFVAFLAGPRAGFITGADLAIDGGYSA